MIRRLVAKLFRLEIPAAPRPRPDPKNLRPGQIRCRTCLATGTDYSRGVALQCHRCTGCGVTTRDREITAVHWENICALRVDGDQRQIAYLAYVGARKDPL